MSPILRQAPPFVLRAAWLAMLILANLAKSHPSRDKPSSGTMARVSHHLMVVADSDDPGQGFQLKADTIPIEGGQGRPVGSVMGSQRL